ncbi:MAG TPA: UDP-galactopyranose mutase, partial [Lactobacillus sp.]|nr:UDP-galactopyranose mutase [Lactobacillus sp.]
GKGDKNKTVITREYPADWKRGDEPYYPVNDKKNNALYTKYQELAKQEAKNVIFGGRLGQYRYYNMDQVISAALTTVKQEFGD